MNKILSNTWAVVALLAVVIASLTTLAVTHVIPATDVVKVLSGFLAGAAAAWQRGTLMQQQAQPAPVPVEEDKPEKVKVPPVLPILMICLAFLPGATCAQGKAVARTANDIAAELCAARYSQLKGISFDEAMNTVCKDLKILQPFINLVLSTQRDGIAPQCLPADEPVMTPVDAGTGVAR